MTWYKTSSTVMPVDIIDTTSSAAYVYLRRNIRAVTDEMDGNLHTDYVWEECKIPKDECCTTATNLVLDENLTQELIDNAPVGTLTGLVNDATVIDGVDAGSIVIINTYEYTPTSTKIQTLTTNKGVHKTRSTMQNTWTAWI